MIGFFIGASIKRQLGAVILVLAWIVFLEPALGGLFPGTKDYLIGPAIGGVLGGSGNDAPSFGHSFAVVVAYLVVLGARRRRSHPAARHHVASGPVTTMCVGAGR